MSGGNKQDTGFTSLSRSAEHGFTSLSRSAENGFTSSVRSAEHGFTSSVRSAEHGFTSLSRSAENGFTLIEMMVALAVFSLAALALLRLEGATLKNAADIESRTLSQIVANNLAVEAITDPIAPSLGKSAGAVTNAGRQWRWARTVARTADARIIRIDIAVTDAQGRGRAALSLARVAL